MNKVILIGRLARDPELRTTGNNLSVASFTIAVNRPFTTQSGQSEADFINCVIWRKQAENLAKFCRKGSQIAVEGRIQVRNYVAQDGSKRYVTEVMCDNVTFLGAKNDGSSGSSYGDNSYQGGPSYPAPSNFSAPDEASVMPTMDIVNEDPFKDFGEEVTLTDDDLPF